MQLNSVCCSALQCVAVYCSVLYQQTRTDGVHTCCNMLQFDTVCCSVLQCVAVCRSVLQCVAVCCSVLQYVLQCAEVGCSVLY